MHRTLQKTKTEGQNFIFDIRSRRHPRFLNLAPMTLQQLKQTLAKSQWTSFAVELRPSTIASQGSIKPFYCFREFDYPDSDTFNLLFTSYADPYGKIPLALMTIRGHVRYGQEHPIAPGAYEIDYIADLEFSVKLLNENLAKALNGLPLADGVSPWTANVPQNVTRKGVPAFGLTAGENFTECDLIYIKDNLLFNGSRNIDGRPFDSPANRPTNLQIPLIRK
jgi:hypothetical protein